jgi:hypothetical protein
MTDKDGYDKIPVAEIKTSVSEWLDRNQALSRSEVNDVDRNFMQEVGQPARRPTELPDGTKASTKNPHMRIGSAESFGIFAAQEDVALIELDPAIECGELFGYPASDDGWAPLLLCVQGPPAEAHTRVQQALVTIESLADGELII